MDTLVSILLYLNVITSSGHYTSAEISNYAVIYSAQINLVETTPGELPPLLVEFEPEAIIVIDNMGG